MKKKRVLNLGRKTTVDNLSTEINSIMQEYAGDITSVMMKDIDTVAGQTVKKIKEKAPKKTGSYAKSWTSKVTAELAGKATGVSKGRGGSITHLLENGHASRNGGRVKSIPHIKEAEEYAVEELVKKLKRRIEHGI